MSKPAIQACQLDNLLGEIRRCTLCEPHLPLGPKPILQAAESARILIAGQAPGRLTHAKGRPFDDASGERLRSWLGVDRDCFYDPARFAIVPMGFCFPGTHAHGRGDLPPRPECAATWHQRLLGQLPHIELTLVLGKYALDYHLPGHQGLAVEAGRWQQHWPSLMVLPHPSPRNNLWLKRHSWFETDCLPALRQRVASLID
ncbi:uracil-DNA glycosylase family protein [Shewanella cyperi]|uniref:uracil-DNA glycosylase family protein n=1 Tax=Shewanella cyperi TaxID=2814292 RepID=UPI001A93D547|nr:uracil-DNA glycosylase family protein [Shewanella cyperi]QSX41999.1 uracil-DNA glycosylase family protein [Shewanella cyperi]